MILLSITFTLSPVILGTRQWEYKKEILFDHRTDIMGQTLGVGRFIKFPCFNNILQVE